MSQDWNVRLLRIMRLTLSIVSCGVAVWIALVYLSLFSPRCKPLIRNFANALFAIGIANFVGFVVVALCIGGDAVGNPPRDGRYYVSEHGRRTEVSRSVYEYSLIHAHSVWGTHALIAFGAFILYCEDRERKAKAAV